MSLKSRIIPVILLVVCSLSFAAFLFRLAEKIIPHEGSNGYAVLAFDASYPDREIGKCLSRIDLGRFYISESTQMVFLDNFGELESIPLDLWEGRLEDFDPRHDGYAEKLKEFFVRDDKRLFFIPLSVEANRLGTRAVHTAFTEALGDIPFSIEFLGYDRPIMFYFLLFAIASLLSVLVSKSPVITLALTPLFAGFAFTGSAGLALSAIMLTMASVITAPLRVLFAAGRYGNAKKTIWTRIMYFFHPVKRIKLNTKRTAHTAAQRLPNIKPLGLLVSIGLFLLFIALYVYTGIISNVSLVFEAAVFGCACIVLPLVLWGESNKGGSQDHIRFTPVPIIGNIAKTPLFTRAAIPFTIAAFLALILPGELGLTAYREGSEYLGDYLIQRSDYEAHLAFQTSFSFTSLGVDSEKKIGNTYVHYYVGEDGLITGTKEYGEYLSGMIHLPESLNDANNGGTGIQEKIIGDFGDFPSFSLESLVDFLDKSGHNEQNVVKTDIDTQNMLPIMMLILPCILALFNIGQKRYRKKDMLVYNKKWNLFRKRIAA
ncbi:MAG: hypothetical protein LBB61_10470 [Treponema sp.]|jgi:hypothetical protein|nr:hypothetical protein [Treponema sp.]